MMKNFNIKNESGDKKYFTQIPNIIVNHSTAYEQSLYLIMKRLAGEGGQCYASLNLLSQKMGVHKTTVSRTIAKLLTRKWIVETSPTKVVGGKTRTFVIIDLWKLNMENYEGGAKMTTSKTDQKSGAISNESGAVVDESGAKSDTSKNSNNIYKKETFFPLNKLKNENDEDYAFKKEYEASKKLEDYKNGIRNYRPFYDGYPMRWKEFDQKWYVIEHGEWLDFAGNELDIYWK